MQKKSLTNKITNCCTLPFSVMKFIVDNLTLSSESDRTFIINNLHQNGTLSIDAWKVWINSGTLEADATLTKAEFLAWFDCDRQPSCSQFKLLIEGYKLGNYNPIDEYGVGWTVITDFEVFNDKIIEKIINVVGGIGIIPQELQDLVGKYYASLGGFTTDKNLATNFKPDFSAGKLVFDELDNDNVAVMKATYDASVKFFDKAFEDKVGDGSLVVLGYDTNYSSVTNEEAIYCNINDVTKFNGVITEIKIKIPTSNPKGFVVLKKNGNLYTTVDYFEISNLVAGNNTIKLDKKIPKDCILGIVYNGSNNGYTDTGSDNSFMRFNGYSMATIGNSSSPNITYDGYLPYTYAVKYDRMSGDEAIDLLKKVRSQNDAVYKPFYLEDYGAVKLDPYNPDAGKDCTEALQACIDAIIADNTINGGKIILRGMYRIGGALKQVAGSTYGQVIIPLIVFSETNMKIKGISIVGEITPIWEEQGIINIPTQYGGCGFYSSIYNQPTSGRANHILTVKPGNGTTPVFGPFNNVNLHIDNVIFLNRTHDNLGDPVKNTMGALNVYWNSNFTFGKIFSHVTTPIHSSLAPDPETYGIMLPKYDNHGTVLGEYIRSIGYGVGLWATEHLQMNLYVGAGNLVGLHTEWTYPISINTITLEMNKMPVRMSPNSFLQAFVYQSERVLDPSKWYFNNTGLDFNYLSGHENQSLNNAPSQVCLTTYIVHNEGGQPVKGAWHSNIRMRIIADEFGQSYLPIPVWSSLPTTQLVDGLEGIFNNEKYIRISGSWKKVMLTN